MTRLFQQYWWLFLLRGIVAVLLGLLALFMPEAAFAGLMIFLGAYMFVEGIFAIIAAFSERRTNRNWGWVLASGVLGVLIGVLTFINPFATGTALVYLIAFWALMIGIAEVALAIRLRKEIRGEGWYILAGALTIIFSVLVLFNPIAGALTLTVLFGIYALIMGVLLIALAVRLRKRHRVIPVE